MVGLLVRLMFAAQRQRPDHNKSFSSRYVCAAIVATPYIVWSKLLEYPLAVTLVDTQNTHTHAQTRDVHNLRPVLALRIRSAYSFRSQSRSRSRSRFRFSNAAQLTRRQQLNARKSSGYLYLLALLPLQLVLFARLRSRTISAELVAPDRTRSSSVMRCELWVQSACLICQFARFFDIRLNWICFYSRVLVHGYSHSQQWVVRVATSIIICQGNWKCIHHFGTFHTL